jgi:hypothetical protein
MGRFPEWAERQKRKGTVIKSDGKGNYVDSIAIFGISSIPIFRIGKDMGFPPFVKM